MGRERGAMRFPIFQDSRIGARPYQQDRLGNWQTEDALLMVVADGMGGHPRGDVAAQIAVRHLAAAFQRAAQPRLADPKAFLVDAVGGAHRGIRRQARELSLPDIPRTTIVACVVQDGQACWSNVGDSRLYHIRRGSIRAPGYTRVQQLVDSGRIRENRASHGLEAAPVPGKRRPHAGARRRCAPGQGDVILPVLGWLLGPADARQLLTR